jgi:hypothetical protein
MQDDPPTMPGLHWEGRDGRVPGGMPTWPVVPRSLDAPAVPKWDRRALLLGMSLVVNGILFASFVFVLLLARAGVLSPPISAGPSRSPAPALSSPTATTSPTPDTGWLQVAPTSMQLGCSGGQQTQYVVLRNTGTDDVQWQVQFASQADQAAVSVNQSAGDLRAGTSMALQIQIRRHATNQGGTIRFDPGTPDAGSPASLSYTIVGCQ